MIIRQLSALKRVCMLEEFPFILSLGFPLRERREHVAVLSIIWNIVDKILRMLPL